jgi:nitrogen regulatory protein PII-like uncharacterized protein
MSWYARTTESIPLTKNGKKVGDLNLIMARPEHGTYTLAQVSDEVNKIKDVLVARGVTGFFNLGIEWEGSVSYNNTKKFSIDKTVFNVESIIKNWETDNSYYIDDILPFTQEFLNDTWLNDISYTLMQEIFF